MKQHPLTRTRSGALLGNHHMLLDCFVHANVHVISCIETVIVYISFLNVFL